VNPYEAAEVLALFELAEDYESLMWRVEMRPGWERETKLFALCNDLFYWATADCEEITVADIPLLRRTLADLARVDATYHLAWLFAARKRKLRPQKPCYKGLEKAVAEMFDECCTEAERQEADDKDRDWWLAFAASQRDRQQK